MGLFGASKTSNKTVGSKFVFADGTKLSPEEYGYLAIRVGSKNAIEHTDACFGEGTLGSSLGLAKAIMKVRFAADIYTSMLNVGIYLWHAASILKVDGAVIERITKGVRDGLADLRAPTGRSLDNDFREFLVHQAYKFATAIQKDVAQAADSHANSFRIQPLPSTELLLDILIQSNTEDENLAKEWTAQLTTPAGVWLWQTIESSSFAGIQALSQHFRVRFEA